MRKTETGDVYYKIVYWGCYSGGKTTAVDTLFKIIQVKSNPIVTPVGDLTKIATPSGATHYFDRGIVKSIAHDNLFYHLYTVAGQKRFQPLRNKVFFGADAIVFVIDGQYEKLDANRESLRELQEIAELPLVEKIPMLVMINKQDLSPLISKEEVMDMLEENGLYFPNGHTMGHKNPPIFETVALRDKENNIYESFCKCIEPFEQKFQYLRIG